MLDNVVGYVDVREKHYLAAENQVHALLFGNLVQRIMNIFVDFLVELSWSSGR